MSRTLLHSCKSAIGSSSFPAVVLLFLAAAIFCTYDISIAPDMGRYLNSALNIYTGNGYMHMDGSPALSRGPLFPLMIAVAFSLLDVSPHSAFRVVRLFAIAGPVLIYYLGKRLYGKWIAFSAALLMLCSYSMLDWSYRHLDAVWPCFVIVSLLLTIVGFEEGKLWCFSCSGILMGSSFLVKEVTIVFFLIPLFFALLIKEYRVKTSLHGVVLYFLILAGMLLPWFSYQYSKTGFANMLGYGPVVVRMILSPTTVAGNTSPNAGAGPLSYLKPFYSFYARSLQPQFLLSPVFIIAWIATIFRAFRKDRNSIFLCLCLLCFVPIIYYVGKYNVRVAHVIIILWLSYLVVAVFLWRSAGLISSKLFAGNREHKKSFQYLLVTIMISGVVCAQVVPSRINSNDSWSFFKRSSLFRRLLGKNDRSVFSRGLNYGSASRDAGEWIRDNMSSGDRLMVSRPSEGSPVYFHSFATCPIFIMSIVSSNRLDEHSRSCADKNMIFVSSWSAKNDPSNKMFALTEEDLFESIEGKKITYIMVNRRRNYLSLYFDENKSFELVKEFGGGEIKIFKVLALQGADSLKTLVSSNAVQYLKKIRKKDSTKFDWYREEYFGRVFGWDKNRFAQMLNLENNKDSILFELVDNGRIY